MSEEKKKTRDEALAVIKKLAKEHGIAITTAVQESKPVLKMTATEISEALSLVKKHIPDSVRLSNKGCPRYYNNAEMSWRGYCGCPRGHCWYDAQKARRKEGKKALSIDFWEASLEKDREDEEE